MINWKRVKRTAIQAATGDAGVALVVAIAMPQHGWKGLIAAAGAFAVSVATAVLMNINTQMEEQEG